MFRFSVLCDQLLPQPTNYLHVHGFSQNSRTVLHVYYFFLLYISFFFCTNNHRKILFEYVHIKNNFYNYCFYYQVISKVGDLVGIKYFPVETRKHKIEWRIKKQWLNCWKSIWPSVLYTMSTLKFLGQALLEISSA